MVNLIRCISNFIDVRLEQLKIRMGLVYLIEIKALKKQKVVMQIKNVNKSKLDLLIFELKYNK